MTKSKSRRQKSHRQKSRSHSPKKSRSRKSRLHSPRYIRFTNKVFDLVMSKKFSKMNNKDFRVMAAAELKKYVDNVDSKWKNSA